MAASHNVFQPSGDAPSEPTGFEIRLQSAQLGDLIQINCLNRIRGAFRVRSAAGEGSLFFDAGQLVHATCAEHVGLDAVVRMLGWRSGSIEPCVLPWPSECSIGMGADALLLHAAQRLDESLRPAEPPRAEVTTKVVRRVGADDGGAERDELAGGLEHEAGIARDVGVQRVAPDAQGRAGTLLPGPHPLMAEPGAEVARAAASAGPLETAGPAQDAPARSSEHSGLSLRSAFSMETLSRLEVARVGGDGKLRRSDSDGASELADTAFFADQLASAIGAGLGLGTCRALACENAKDGLVVFTARSIVGVRGARRDLELVLAKVGLD